MKSYIGYIVGKEETNPVSVWIPSKSGYCTYGSSKGFGSNAGNLSLVDLAFIRMNAEKCYLSTEMSSQGPYLYDDANGYATKEDNIAVLDDNTVKNVKDKQIVANKYSSPGDGEFIHSPHSNPASNWLQTYYPQTVEGAEINTYSNAPGGNYCTMSIGTKVLVSYPDDKGIGFIIRQIPYDDEMSKVIKDLSGS